LDCGISQTFTLSTLDEEVKTFSYCVDLGPVVGLADVNYSVSGMSAGASFEIIVDYDGVVDTTGFVSTGGVITFDKNNVAVETVLLTVNYIGDLSLSILADCCNAATLNVVQIVLTNDYESGDTVHTQYRYVDGAFTSPLQSSLVIFTSGTSTPLVSRYNLTTDFVGTGAFPPAGSVVRLISNQFATDTFVFNPAEDSFQYHVSDTLYGNNSVDLNTLLGLATTATPNLGGGSVNYAEFIVPTLENYLYLIWDFREATPLELCFSDMDLFDVCCICVASETLCYSNLSALDACCNCSIE
jgi:hypothetical protein